MLRFRFIIIWVLCLSWAIPSFAQEELGNLWNRSKTGMYLTESSVGSAVEVEEVVYDSIIHLLDTLEIPLYEDFTRYRIKSFVTDTNHVSVFDSLTYRYTFNGSFIDTFGYKVDTVWNYKVDPQSQQLDSAPAPTFEVVLYIDSLNPFFVSDVWTVYPSYSTYTQNGVSRIINHDPDSILVNEVRKHYFSRDDGYTFWISEGGFWNRTMGLNPPTVGMLTFDGLDKDGKPYDNTDRLAYGSADEFTSKPIALYGDGFGRYTADDSIYLSFFIQPHGNGDRPEREDSLILEFYSPTKGRWDPIWSSAGDTLQDFKEYFIHIADTHYLQYGFKFRFRNYATLSGNFDHWHLDYIRLDKDRNLGDDIFDFAFTRPLGSMLKDYSSMPYIHYKSNPNAFVKGETSFNIRNLGPQTDLGTSFYKVYRNGEINPHFRSELLTNPTFPALDTFNYVHSLNSANNFYSFPSDTNERQLFILSAYASATNQPGEFEVNDTFNHVQLFDRYYSYDDGSAEKTYNLNLVGTSVVVEYNSVIPDTLRAVNINFLETFETPTTQQVNILVYRDLNEAPVYQSGPVDVIYQAAGDFYRYRVTDIPVDGKFYVGYQQLTANKTYVGYDVNTNNQNNTYISQIGSNWFNSIFLGTLMIRADFGYGNDLPLSNQVLEKPHNSISFYPNPAQNRLYFNDAIQGEVTIFNLGGQVVTRKYTDGYQLDVSELKNGLYFVQVEGFSPSKLIIAR